MNSVKRSASAGGARPPLVRSLTANSYNPNGTSNGPPRSNHKKSASVSTTASNLRRKLGTPIAFRDEDEATPYESIFVNFPLATTPSISIQHSVSPDATTKLQNFTYGKLHTIPPGGPPDGRFQGGPDELLCVRLDGGDFSIQHYVPEEKTARIQALSFQRFDAPPPPPVRDAPRLLNLGVRDEGGLKNFVVLQSWPFGSLVDAYVRFYRKGREEERPHFRFEGMRAWERIDEGKTIHDVSTFGFSFASFCCFLLLFFAEEGGG